MTGRQLAATTIGFLLLFVLIPLLAWAAMQHSGGPR